MDETKTLTGSYEADLYGLATQQAALLREGRLSEVEADHLAEQIEELGMSEYDKLESVPRVMLLHMLKWDLQPERQSRNWSLTIQEQRRRLERHLAKNPSLKSRRDEAVEAAYGDARLGAVRETDLPLAAFPEAVVYTWENITARPFAWDR